MEANGDVARSVKRRKRKKRKKAKEQAVLSVISVRLSDSEMELIDDIMQRGNFKHYSDIIRMAIHMYRGPHDVGQGASGIYH